MSSSADKLTLVINAVILSVLFSCLPIAVVWWIIGIGFFGVVSGPPASPDRWYIYTVVALTSTAFIFGFILHKQLKRYGLKIKPFHSFIIALISPIFLFISMGIITLTQFAEGRHDGLIALGGLVLSLCCAIVLTNSLSKPSKHRTISE